jgi:hypothetical protein
MHSDGRQDWTYWLLYPYMAVALIPWVAYRFRMRYAFPLLAVWLFFALARRRVVRLPAGGVAWLTWAIVFFWLYQAMDFVFLLFGHTETGVRPLLYLDSLHVVGAMLILHLSIRNACFRELRHLIIFCLACMGVGAIMTFAGTQEIQGGSRALTGATGDGADVGTISAALEAGIGGYGHVYGWGLLIFPMCSFLRFVSWPMRLGFTALAILLGMAVYRAEYTICLMGTITGGILYLLTVLQVRRPVLRFAGITAIVLMVFLLVFPQSLAFLSRPLRALGDMTTSVEYRSRLVSVADTVEGSGDSYLLYRSGLYWKSWRTFLRHPIFGAGTLHYQRVGPTTKEEKGGHSMIFDLLAQGGVFGLLILVLFVSCHYRYLRSLSATVLGNRWWPAYHLFLYPACAIAFVNPLMGYTIMNILVLYVPALAVLAMMPAESAARMRVPG